MASTPTPVVISVGRDPEKTARFLLSAWEGALISARVDRAADAFDSFFDIALGTLLTPR